MKNTLKTVAAAATMATASLSAQSEILWSDINLTYLNGDSYVNPGGFNL